MIKIAYLKLFEMRTLWVEVYIVRMSFYKRAEVIEILAYWSSNSSKSDCRSALVVATPFHVLRLEAEFTRVLSGS